MGVDSYYVATMPVDYNTPIDNIDYQCERLLNALWQAGWSYAETSALYIETDDIGLILMGLELLARSAADPGPLSAISIQAQLVGPDREPPAARNHRRALDHMVSRALPSERGDDGQVVPGRHRRRAPLCVDSPVRESATG